MKSLMTLAVLVALAGCTTAAPTPPSPSPQAEMRAVQQRSSAVRAEFVRTHPCPATGVNAGACPGWVVDHIIPLSVYGADHPDNMQWQTIEAAKRKDKLEREAYQNRVKAEKALCPKP